jgi:hypothetical protein
VVVVVVVVSGGGWVVVVVSGGGSVVVVVTGARVVVVVGCGLVGLVVRGGATTWGCDAVAAAACAALVVVVRRFLRFLRVVGGVFFDFGAVVVGVAAATALLGAGLVVVVDLLVLVVDESLTAVSARTWVDEPASSEPPTRQTPTTINATAVTNNIAFRNLSSGRSRRNRRLIFRIEPSLPVVSPDCYSPNSLPCGRRAQPGRSEIRAAPHRRALRPAGYARPPGFTMAQVTGIPLRFGPIRADPLWMSATTHGIASRTQQPAKARKHGGVFLGAILSVLLGPVVFAAFGIATLSLVGALTSWVPQFLVQNARFEFLYTGTGFTTERAIAIFGGIALGAVAARVIRWGFTGEFEIHHHADYQS